MELCACQRAESPDSQTDLRNLWGCLEIWVAFAPVWRLVVAFVVGKPTQASGNVLLERGCPRD
jgi:hypothetical protein